MSVETQTTAGGKKDSESGPSLEVEKMGTMFQMMNHIQSLINTAVENAKMEEKQLLTEKSKNKHIFSIYYYHYIS